MLQQELISWRKKYADVVKDAVPLVSPEPISDAEWEKANKEQGRGTDWTSIFKWTIFAGLAGTVVYLAGPALRASSQAYAARTAPGM